MAKYKYVLFDLDGTLSESAPGIRESLEYAISRLGKSAPNLDDYSLYIGPPLIDTFRNLCRFSQQDSEKGVEFYREYYNSKGKLLNRLYSGMEDVLSALKNQGAKLAICSSKFEKFVEEIADILQITKYFDAVCGSNLDGSRKDKKDLIPYALQSLGTSLDADRDSALMIGDTHFDAEGAKLCSIDFIGVEYGYGDVNLMKNQGAEVFAKTPKDLTALLCL